MKNSVSSLYYKLLEKSIRWKKKYVSSDKYTILLTLPSDLPCMAFFSINYLEKMNIKNCKEIIVILDETKDKVSKLLSNSNIVDKVIKPKNFFVKSSGSPYKYHWLQLISGLNESNTEYSILKGCNLFMKNIEFYDNYFDDIKSKKAILAGIRERPETSGVKIGTYEMIVSSRIKDECKPIDILAKNINGINYDNFLYIQKILLEKYGTKSIILYKKNPEKVHIGHLIGNYRKLGQSKRKFDPALRLWFLTLSNELLKNTKWYRKDFITLEEYYNTYESEYPEDIYHQFFPDIRWLIKFSGLDLKLLEKEILKAEKFVKVKDCSDWIEKGY